MTQLPENLSSTLQELIPETKLKAQQVRNAIMRLGVDSPIRKIILWIGKTSDSE
ncbi:MULTISPECIES: hypothetical protein [Cyanophyceae]|uniref:hypothetical protein n=1 Tax=Cyanophyceae TaxID=3028117 RepID=UPI001689179D|nr:hypothetical protein [Trichocoleus sp. FACHB-69]MBD1931809.1 hypothetical protein [Trichocoleus sp. FACHB-69]